MHREWYSRLKTIISFILLVSVPRVVYQVLHAIGGVGGWVLRVLFNAAFKLIFSIALIFGPSFGMFKIGHVAFIGIIK